MDKTNKIKGTYRWIVRTLFTIIFFAILYYTYQSKIKFGAFNWSFLTHPAFYVAFLFVFLNYFLEFKKWKLVLQTLQLKPPTSTAIQSFFAGIITGLLTPNMQGNFLGRIYYFERKDRISITLLTLLGNFAALLVTIGFGLLGTYFYTLESINSTFLSYTGLVILFLSIFFYFTFERWKIFPRKWKWLIRLRKTLEQNPNFRLKTTLWSAARYSIFSIQYVLILHACGLTLDFNLLLAVFTIYLITTLIPSVFLGKIGVRESASLLVLANYTSNASLILTASLLIWVINLVLPALCGLLICRTKWLF